MDLIKRKTHLPQLASPPPAASSMVPEEKLVAVVPPPQVSAAVVEMVEQAYSRLYPRLCALAARKLGREVADDIVQDVFAKLVRVWTRLTPEQLTDAAITKMVKRRIIDVARAQGREPPSVDYTEDLAEQGLVPSIGPVEPGTVLYVEEAVARFVPQLSPRYREAWEKVRDEELTYEEAAAEMEISAAGVKWNLKHANLMVREAMTDAGYRIEAGSLVKALPRSTQSTQSTQQGTGDGGQGGTSHD